MACKNKKTEEVVDNQELTRTGEIDEFCSAMEEQQEGRTHFCDVIFNKDENNVKDKEDAEEFYEDLADDEIGSEGDADFADDFDGKNKKK